MKVEYAINIIDYITMYITLIFNNTLYNWYIIYDITNLGYFENNKSLHTLSGRNSNETTICVKLKLHIVTILFLYSLIH